VRNRLIASGIVAALAAVAIIFTRARNFEVALIAVLAFATAQVAIEVLGALKLQDRMLKGTIIRLSASVIVLSALFSSSLTGPNDGYRLLVMNVAIVSYGFFAIEAFKVARAGFRSAAARDHITLGGLNLVILVVYVLDILGNYRLGEIPAAGIFAAYAGIVAVLSGLKAFDPKQAG
jgi:hypothetical protein